jgi:hypothetical protein
MRRSARSFAVAWDVMKFSMTASLAVAIGLSALATLGPAIAQEAPKAESATTPSATVEGTSDRGRHHRRKHDDTAKAAEGAAKPDSAAKAEAGAKTPPVSTNDSSTVAVIKPEQECRTVTPTGSRMFKTICATPEQWKEVDDRGAEGARQTKQTLNDSAAIARPTPPSVPGGGFGP